MIQPLIVASLSPQNIIMYKIVKKTKPLLKNYVILYNMYTYNINVHIIILIQFLTFQLEYLEIFTVFRFCVLLAKHPREHLSGFEAGFYKVSVFVPMVVSLTTVSPFESDLREDAHQQLVDVVIDAHRHFNVLGSACARQVSTLCEKNEKHSIVIIIVLSFKNNKK